MDFVGSIRQDAERFYAAAATASPDQAVPSCPGWTVADLVWHLGEVHWFWATGIDLLATDPDQIEAVKPARPSTFADTVAWGRAQAERLLTTLEATPDSTPVWTWSPPHQTVGFVRRHQVQETAVHRWDLQQAVGIEPDPIEADAAADAIDEVLAVTLPWGVPSERPLPGTVHLHCTDVPGEWFVDADGTVEAIHAKGDVAVRGTASDLLLVLFGRVDMSAVEVIGDADLATEFLARVRTD